MTLAEIIRAQLATGRPLRVTRALLEALGPVGARQMSDAEAAAWRERDEARRNASAWADERDAMRRERDEARFSLAERTAEREALIERVSVLEEERDEARESLAREQRRLSDRLDVDVLVGGASMHGADDALWRPGETRAECWARHIREAEERGARWAMRFRDRAQMYTRSDEDAQRYAKRICAEARKAGEHE